MLDFRKCRGLVLSHETLCLFMNLSHPPAAKHALEPSDLKGQRIMMIRRGWSDHMDALRDYLDMNVEAVTIDSFDFFNIDVFNRRASSDALLVGVKLWDNLHPLLTRSTVTWNYTVPYGLLHAPEPAPVVRDFLDAVMDVTEE